MKLLKFIRHHFSATPIFLALSFLLAQFLHNIGDLQFSAVIKPAAVMVLLIAAMSGVASVFIRNEDKRALILSAIVFFNFSIGEAVYCFKSLGLSDLGQFYALFPVWLILLGVSIIYIGKTPRNLAPFRKFLFLLSLFSVLVPLADMVPFILRHRADSLKAKSPLALPAVDRNGIARALPDIYYIIPDSYTSSASLNSWLGSDNRDFVRYLEGKGFYVPEKSTSNYPMTFLSVASTLNMEYLDYLSIRKNSTDKTLASPLINDNNVKKYLGKLGYKYYQLGSWWELTNTNPEADANFISPDNYFGKSGYFNYTVLYSTLAGPFIDLLLPRISPINLREEIARMTDYQFKELPEIAKADGPKFVFAHILAPHPPYVYGRDCGFLRTAQKGLKESYADQVQCVNAELTKIIDSIIGNSKIPPVILVQSDEGVVDFDYQPSTEDAWGEASDAILKQKFPIFAAYYLPGVPTSSLYSTISNVNSFREILNLYFSAGLPLLPDRNFIIKDEKDLYGFIDVTERVDNR